MATKQPKKAPGRIRQRAAEPSTWAGVGVVLSALSAGLQAFTTTGSRTAAVGAAIAAGAAMVMPERGGATPPAAK